MSPFVAEILLHSLSAVLYYLISIRAFLKQFFVSATKLEIEFPSPCLLASTAECTRLLKFLIGGNSNERCLFLKTRSDSRFKKNRGLIKELFCDVKLEVNNFRG